MSLIYTAVKSKKKQNKKPGWKKEAEEYAAWIAKHAPNPKLQKELQKADKKLSTVSLTKQPRITKEAKSVQTAPIIERKIHDPRVMYKDDPEMLERELKARERKFTAAPIYNKGGDVLVTDEMMKDIMAGVTRRR
jgi:4-hydroxy-L-threonine phosphate dehydrogenase PdxA